MNKVERRYISDVVIETRSDDDGNEINVIEGYAALFNSRAKIGDWFEEEILPGAFDSALSGDVRCLLNHDPNLILARSKNGTGTLKLSIDEKGLKYSYETPDISYARDLAVSISRGDVTQSSFAFIPEETNWIERDGEMDLRQIVKVKELRDVSPVTFPAYADTTVSKRCWEEFRESKKSENTKKLDEYEARFKFNLNNSEK